jgi:DNA-binding SARP family transcriptional activator
MEYGVLGSLEVRRGDEPLPLGGPKQRALLALLLVNANGVVARDRLIDELWGENPPDTAVKTTQVYVSRLRKLLPDGALLTRARGYLLVVDPAEFDLARFEHLVTEARGTVPSQASRLLHEALGLWRGPALAEFEEPFARAEGGRLEDLRLAALEERIEADLALGLHAEVARELERVVPEHPHRERLRAQLMIGLYRCGRQAEALAVFRDARAALDEIGLEPSTKLRALEKQILTHDEKLELRPPQLASPGSIALPGPLVTAPPFPFVGRARELTTLRSLLERADHGEGGLVLLSGEPGGGKTRLLREFAQEAVGRGSIVCYGVSDPSVTVPYQPLLEWLEFLVRVCDPAALAGCLSDGGEALSRLLPAFAGFAATPPTASAADAPADRFLLQSSVADFFRRLSDMRSLLLVAEDIHWADAETLLLLTRLGRAAPEARVLVVASFRQPGEEIGPELADTLASLSRLDGVTRIALANLTADELVAFVHDATQADASAELVAAIGELTDGTPLLVCELWRELVASDAVSICDANVSLTRPAAELRSPERISELVDQRLSRLSPVTGMLIEIAAVTGPRFELRVVADAAGLDQPAFTAALEQATRSGIIEDLPAAAPAYRFTHELLRRAVYDRISGIRRAELHLRVGDALGQIHSADDSRVLSELAHHFTLAAPLAGTERAIAYNRRAAEAASSSAAYEEAIARLSTALELRIADARERAHVQAQLGYLLHESGRVSEAMVVLAASLEAATGIEERGLATRALVHSAQVQLYSYPEGRATEMIQVAEDAIGTFEQLDDRTGIAVSEALLAEALGRQGRHEEAFDALDRALAHADATGDRILRREIVGQIGRRLCDGPTPAREAIDRMETARSSARDDPLLDAGLRRCLAFVLAMTGRFVEAREHIEASNVPLDQTDQTSFSFSSHWMAAQAKALIGDLVGAEQELIAAFCRMRDARGDEPESRALRAAAILALLYEDQGRWDEAAEYLSYGQEIDLVEPAKGKIYAPLRLAARARLAAHRGDPGEGLELALQGVRLGERNEWLNDGARVWLALAEVQRASGLLVEAEASLTEALRLYDAKGNVAAAARVREALILS